MKALYVVLKYPVGKKFHGSDSGYALRPLNLAEIVAVEDRLFNKVKNTKFQKERRLLYFRMQQQDWTNG